MQNKKAKILIVDDNETNRLICSELLEQGYELRFAEDGFAAVHMAQLVEPDLILLDVMMPGLNGLEVCQRLRSSTRPWVKILMISAKVQKEDRIAGYEAGADDYIGKPFDEDELIAKIDIHLKLKRAEEIDELKHNVLRVLQHGNRSQIANILLQTDTMKRQNGLLSREHDQCLNAIEESANTLQQWMVTAENLIELKCGRTETAHTAIELASIMQSVSEKLGIEYISNEPHPMSSLSNQKILADIDLLEKMFDSLILDCKRRSDDETDIQFGITNGENGCIDLSFCYPAKSISAEVVNALGSCSSDEKLLMNRGDGMSLAVAKEIAILHGGYIQLELKSDNRVKLVASLPKKPQDVALATLS